MAKSHDFSQKLRPKKDPIKLAVCTYFGYEEENSGELESPICRLGWKKSLRKPVSCKGGNTSNLF